MRIIHVLTLRAVSALYTCDRDGEKAVSSVGFGCNLLLCGAVCC